MFTLWSPSVSDDASQETPRQVLERMFRDMCPVTAVHIPEEERETLLGFIEEVMKQRDEFEGQLSVVQRTMRANETLAARAREIMLQYASFIPDEAVNAEDVDEVGITLPGRLARPLCRMGQDATVAEAAAMLSKKRGVTQRGTGYVYPNLVIAHSLSASGKALHLEDSATRENFCVAVSQIVRQDSQVKEPGDAGVLVVTRWLAAQKGWKV